MKQPIDLLLDKVEWKQTHIEIPADTNKLYATHEGVLKIDEIDIRCYILNNGQRVFNQEDICKLFEL